MPKPLCFFQQKWRERPFRVHGSAVTLTKSAACAQKFARRQRALSALPSKGPYQQRQNPYSGKVFGEIAHEYHEPYVSLSHPLNALPL